MNNDPDFREVDEPIRDVSDVWFKLPIKLRQRWWNETGYGRKPPSLELCAAVAEAAKIERFEPFLIDSRTAPGHRGPITHELKSWPEFFAPLKSGEKTFELRKNDRNFQIDDICVFLEYNDKAKQVTGRRVAKRINYILDGVGGGAIAPLAGLQHGYCILGLSDLDTAS